MTKLLSLVCCLLLSIFVYAQDPDNVIVTEELEMIGQNCEQVNVCAAIEDTEERNVCITEAARSCDLDIDLDFIFSVFEKKSPMTTGVKNDEWRKMLKRIFDSSKLKIDKNNTTGASFSVVNKETGKAMIRVPLTRVNAKTFSSAPWKKLSMKEISAYVKGRTPTYGNALGLVALVLKRSTISVTVK